MAHAYLDHECLPGAAGPALHVGPLEMGSIRGASVPQVAADVVGLPRGAGLVGGEVVRSMDGGPGTDGPGAEGGGARRGRRGRGREGG